MPTYTYECDRCEIQRQMTMTFDEHDTFAARHPHGFTDRHDGCLAGIFKQVFSFHINLGMREHYSDQLQTHVSSDRQFNSELSRQQDEYQERTGLEAKFETIDPNDARAAGVTDAGLESQERAQHDATADGHRSIFT